MFLPREHGAYGQLLAPIAVALAIGRPGVAALALAAGAIAAFIAHEPLVVLLGQRGLRVARERGMEARWWFAVSAALALILGTVGFVVIQPDARMTVLPPLVLVLTLAAWTIRGAEHTAAGELVSAVALSSVSLPVARAAGASMTDALTCAIVFGVMFVVATVAVRVVVRWARGSAGVRARVFAAAVAVGGAIFLATLGRAGVVNDAGVWAALPACAVAVWLVAVPPSPRLLRRVGWILVGVTCAGAIVLIVALR